MTLKNRVIFLVGLTVTFISIFWVINKIDLTITKKILLNTGFENVLILMLIYIISFIPRGLRSKIMISSIKYIQLKIAFFSVIIGYSFNAFMPFRIGEIVRALYLKSQTQISGFSCIGSIALERIFDSLVLITFLFMSFYFSGLDKSSNIFLIAQNILIFIIIFLIFSIIFYQYRYTILNFIKNFSNENFSKFLEKILNSFAFIKDKISLLKITFYSFLIWTIEGFMYIYLAYSLNIPNPLIVGFFSLGVVSIGVLLPSSPGHIGVYELSIVLAFQLLGLDTSVGAAYAIIIHITQLITILMMGAIISPSALKGLNIISHIKN